MIQTPSDDPEQLISLLKLNSSSFKDLLEIIKDFNYLISFSKASFLINS